MPHLIKYLTKKLGRGRRLSNPSSLEDSGTVHQNGGGQRVVDLAEQMAELDLFSKPAKPTAPENEGTKACVFGNPDFEYVFSIVLPTQAWPGPTYDEDSVFAPGVLNTPPPTRRKYKTVRRKRQLSPDNRPVKRETRKHKNTLVPMESAYLVKAPRPSSSTGALAIREPPLHLLNLPGEIRNEIYRLLCLSSKPIIAQFRPIAMFRKEKTRRGERHIRRADEVQRFPREPVLALLSKQVHREALSLFYAENKFTFRRSEQDVLCDWVMTQPETMSQWSPDSNLGSSLTHLKLDYSALTQDFETCSVSYTFRKLVSGKVSVSKKATGGDCCTCADRRAVEDWLLVSAVKGQGTLMEEMLRLARIREVVLKRSLCIASSGPGSPAEMCQLCQQPLAREIEGAP